MEKYGKQLTNIDWYFDHYGPYVSDVLDDADDDKVLSINKTTSNYGTVKYIVKPKRDKEDLVYRDLYNSDTEILDKVISETEDLSWNEFIDYVYSTKPIQNSNRYSKLDLSKFV